MKSGTKARQIGFAAQDKSLIHPGDIYFSGLRAIFFQTFTVTLFLGILFSVLPSYSDFFEIL